jgi:hypothetical protein
LGKSVSRTRLRESAKVHSRSLRLKAYVKVKGDERKSSRPWQATLGTQNAWCLDFTSSTRLWVLAVHASVGANIDVLTLQCVYYGQSELKMEAPSNALWNLICTRQGSNLQPYDPFDFQRAATLGLN